tara:strand:+ start:1947 stop:2249 length:303 start_codon:yes stop_codon:yes gene_type:complete
VTEDPKDYIGKNYYPTLDYLSSILKEKLIFGREVSYVDLSIDEYGGELYPKCYYDKCKNHTTFDKNNIMISLEKDESINRYFFHEDCLDSLITERLSDNL